VDGVLVNNAAGQFNYSFVNPTQSVKIFEVKLLVASVLNSGCMDTMVHFIKVFPRPVAGVLGAVPDNGCSPVTINLFSNALGATKYQYDFNDGSVLDTNVAVASHNFINNASLTTRNFNIKLVVSNEFGCSDNTSKLVSIKPTVTAVITSGDTVGCTPYSVGLNGLNSVNSNIYSWDFGDGTSSVLATPVKVFNNTTDSIQNYTIQLITDRTGVNCPDTTTFKLRVFPKPVVEFAPNPLVLGAIVFIAGFSLGIGQPLTMTLVSQLTVPEERALAVSTRLTGNRLGQFIVPAGAGLIAASAGASAVFIGLAILLAATFLPRVGRAQ
jgi:hypothetical protein